MLARIFTRPVLEGIARRGCAKELDSQLRKLKVGEGLNQSLAERLDSGLDELNKQYRCEYVYKSAIASRLVFGRHSPRTASLAVELSVAGSIVDCAVFNGTSTAYEIKTEFDGPARLMTQTPAYLRAFECVNLVTHPDLVQKYDAILDPRVGICALNTDNSLSVWRRAVPDVERLEASVIFRMLRRAEFMEVVSKHFGPQPPMPNGLVDAHHAALFAQLSSADAHRALVDAMRARTTDSQTVNYLRALPVSLRALGYAAPLSTPQRERVLSALSASV